MKTKIILLIVFLFVAVVPAQAARGQQASFFAITEDGEGLPLPYKHEVLFTAAMFDASKTRAFEMQGDTFMASVFGDIYQVTGRCYQFYPDGLLRIYAHSSDGAFLVANGQGKFFDFTFVTDSQWIQIGATAGTQQGYNVLKCSLLFEVVP